VGLDPVELVRAGLYVIGSLGTHMNDAVPLPRFRKPPVSEVAVGVQFPGALNPVHLGLYYQRVKGDFPKVQVQPPIPPMFETFGTAPVVAFGIPTISLQPRMWFISADDDSLIQLQSDRLIFNWRGSLRGSEYPHFEKIYAGFARALDELETLAEVEGIAAGVSVNQCEVSYVNPLPTAKTGVSLSEPEKLFRGWSGGLGVEWKEPQEDLSFTVRYRLNDREGKQFGRLSAAVMSSSAAPNIAPGFQLEMTARGVPMGTGREGIASFHDQAHGAIVRTFAAITTPEMHKLWERYQ
jgi:uncharacterized protein (TIGR04255 family)